MAPSELGYRVRAFAFENANLKLLSGAFALLLYASVHGSQDAQRSLLVSLVALTPPENANRELVTSIPPEIRVTVRGPRSTLDDLHADEASYQMDLRGGALTRFTFDPAVIPLPPGLKIEQIDPPAIDPQMGGPHRSRRPGRGRDRGNACARVRGEGSSHRRAVRGASPWAQERGARAPARPLRRI